MRSSMLAQSWLSVPPAPAWTSTNVSKPSASPDKSASSSRRAPSPLSRLRAASDSPTTPASFSASPSSIRPTLSSTSRSMRPSAESCSSSEVRSCISRLARWGSFHRLGSSARWFSSARRARALSKSKMPPQQPQGLLDFAHNRRNFRAHDLTGSREELNAGCSEPAAIAQGACRSVQAAAAYGAIRLRADANGLGAAHGGDCVVFGRSGSGLEGFQYDARGSGPGALTGLDVDADELDAGRHAERHCRLVGQRRLEEILGDRRREVAAGSVAAEMARLVVAHVNTDYEVGREADEPGILFVGGGAGLAGNRLLDLVQHSRGAALDHTFHDRGDLISGHWIKHLLAPIDQAGLGLVLPFLGIATAAFALIVLVDRAAIAILDALGHRRCHPPSAIGNHRISADHPQHRPFS